MSFISDLKQSIIYPFEDEEWLKKTWPIILISFIPVIGIFGLILLKGWRFETIKCLKNNNGKLPNFDFVVILKRGLFLWGAMLSYFIVPSIICALLGIGGPIGFLVDVYTMIVDGFGAWTESQPGDWILTLLVYMVWGIISYPIYQAGMIRYLLTDNWKTIFNVPANTLLFLRNIHYFIKFYLFWSVILVALFILDFIFAFTGIGLLLIPPLSICLYYSTTAYELSHLVQAIEARKKVKST